MSEFIYRATKLVSKKVVKQKDGGAVDEWSGSEYRYSGGEKSKTAPRCYESHPTLKVGKGILCGGSASWPKHKDADVYVSLQKGSTCGRISDPWDENGHVCEVQYAIDDMGTPTNIPRFKAMITWLCTQLQDGKKVHVGCIGGHGRTGMILSAIAAEALGKKDAIQWVRKHYCQKVVESKAQVAFLVKHYGVSEASASKGNGVDPDYARFTDSSFQSNARPSAGGFEAWKANRDAGKSAPSRPVVPSDVTSSTTKYVPLASSRCVWGKAK